MYWYMLVGCMKLAVYKNDDLLGYFESREDARRFIKEQKAA